jgi:GntR family transcriptional repressor for pyruvate dehydrogenase complex
MEVTKIQHKTIVEEVMEKIKILIASGRYKVNDKLPTEKELAKMFGIGHSSVREAIKIFNYLGILESRVAKGTYVCDRSSISSEALTWSILLNQREVKRLLEIKGALELWSLITLAEKHGQEPASVSGIFAVLEQIIERMDRAISTGSADDLIEADYDFHQTTVQASDNSLFVSIYDTLRSFTLEEIKRCHEAVEYPLIPKHNHQQILKAIKSGDIVQIVLIYKQFVAENIDAVTRSTSGAAGREEEITDDHRKEV